MAGARSILHLDEPGLTLEVRTDRFGNKYLHFDFMAVSDIHLGTRHSRAKRTSHMLEHTQAAKMIFGGDEVDLVYLRRKKIWNFAPWHRQVLAHILRKKAQGADVVKLNDNHAVETRGKKLLHEGREVWHRKLSGKALYDVPIIEEGSYTDFRGRKFRWLHGDEPFDNVAFGDQKGFWYVVGDILHTGIANLDAYVQTFPKFDGISLAAISKKLTKTIINKWMGVNDEITRTVDEDPTVDGLGSGHSHMGEIRTTPGGKLVLNTDCCTDHVRFIASDGRHFGLVTWHKDRLDILEENGRQRTVYFADIGLKSFLKESALIEDEHTSNADRVIRLIYRMAAPKDRQKMLAIQPRETCNEAVIPVSHPHREEQEMRRMLARMRKTEIGEFVAA